VVGQPRQEMARHLRLIGHGPARFTTFLGVAVTIAGPHFVGPRAQIGAVE
jgi:hypothetical protein